MSSTIATVHGKARAFVDGLARLPPSDGATAPHGHFARDYNTLRKLAMEVAPGLDERLLGKYIGVYDTAGTEFSQASYVEIEVYARQIVEQLALLLCTPVAESSRGVVSQEVDQIPVKSYDVAIIRKEHYRAYAA
jgi:hypothetical protein